MKSSPSLFLSQLERLDRDFPVGATGRKARGELIIDMLTRGAGFAEAAVILVEGDRPKRAAETGGWGGGELDLDVEGVVTEGRVIVAPIQREGKRYGVIGAEGDLEDGVEVLRMIAGQIAIVFDNRRLHEEMREGEFQSKMQLLELESLYDIGLSIASTLNVNELTDEILMRSLSILNARSAALFLRDSEGFTLHRAFGEVGSERLDQVLEPSVFGDLIEGGKPLTRKAAAIFPASESAIAVPIRSDRGTIGVLAAADRELREGIGEFDQDDIRTLSLFAAQAAIALESARLHTQALEKQTMERELELAAMIQQDILPTSLAASGVLEIELWNRPARQLGGDFYAVFVGEGKTTFCVADVSGKSTPAAILVSACHAALQLLMAENLPLGEIATRLNQHIHTWSAQNKFITLILATVDYENQKLRYVNAGHNPAFVLGSEGLTQIRSTGLPVGLMPDSDYEELETSFAAGSLLCLYSDGITEAEAADDEEYGYDRLTAILSEHGNEGVEQIRRLIVEDVERFTAGVSQLDDQTIVLVRTGN